MLCALKRPQFEVCLQSSKYRVVLPAKTTTSGWQIVSVVLQRVVQTVLPPALRELSAREGMNHMRIRTRTEGILILLKNLVCITCSEALSRVQQLFFLSKRQGSEIKRRQVPKNQDKQHYRNLVVQNEWLHANVLDAMGNYLYSQQCITAALQISNSTWHDSVA